MMGRRLLGRSAGWRVVSRVERPDAVVMALLQAGVAVLGWYGEPFWLAVAVAAQLVVGGLGGVWIIGPANARLGFARYAVVAATGVSLTLSGRTLPGGIAPFFIPVAVLLAWAVVRLELELERTGRGRTPLELIMVALVFGAAQGTQRLLPTGDWPAALGLLLLVVLVPSLRLAEARGRYGVQAIGESLLHLLAVVQVAAAVHLLDVPGLVAAALVALAFHAWSGAAEALGSGTPARAVALEFGALAVLGLVVALLLQGG
jgi:hypothetical protein